jgi:hypothetical protein
VVACLVMVVRGAPVPDRVSARARRGCRRGEPLTRAARGLSWTGASVHAGHGRVKRGRRSRWRVEGPGCGRWGVQRSACGSSGFGISRLKIGDRRRDVEG